MWLDYLDRYPPLHETVPQLLATIASYIYNFSIDPEKQSAKAPHEMMWWLHKPDPEELNAVEESEGKAEVLRALGVEA